VGVGDVGDVLRLLPHGLLMRSLYLSLAQSENARGTLTFQLGVSAILTEGSESMLDDDNRATIDGPGTPSRAAPVAFSSRAVRSCDHFRTHPSASANVAWIGASRVAGTPSSAALLTAISIIICRLLAAKYESKPGTYHPVVPFFHPVVLLVLQALLIIRGTFRGRQ
jgi:hypothetical protein